MQIQKGLVPRLAFASIFGGPFPSAQTATTGVIEGSITDPQGHAAPDMELTEQHSDFGEKRAAPMQWSAGHR